MLATGTLFGGYFNIRDRLVWEFNLFVYHGIEIKLGHKITGCVFRSWNIILPFITKYSKNRQFWNTFIVISKILYTYCNLWNNKADIVISSFNNEWALVHWWQWQAAVESSLLSDEHAPGIPPAKPFAQPSKAARNRSAMALIWRLI